MLYAGVGEADSLSPPFIIQSNRMAGFLEEKLHWEEMLSFFCLKWHSDGSEFICLFSNCIRCCLFRSFINDFHQLLYLATILQRAFTGCTNKMERNCFNAMRCFGEECNVQVLCTLDTWVMHWTRVCFTVMPKQLFFLKNLQSQVKYQGCLVIFDDS